MRRLDARHIALACALVLLLAMARSALAFTLPGGFATLVPGAREAGAGNFRYFGLLIYEAKLWTSGVRFDETAPFALGILYARNIKGARLAEESVNQWRRMGYGASDKYPAWGGLMERVFPDVKPGDELIAFHIPDKGVQFYFNGELRGEISDSTFARAFFAIWLDARTTEPELRRALIGGK